MKLYQVVESIGKENTAGSKAVQDVVNIANTIGYEKLYIKRINSSKNIFSKISRQIIFLIQWNSLIKKIEPGSILLLQHPFRTKQLGRENCLKKLKEKNIKIISLIHDVEQLRNVFWNTYYKKEFRIMLQTADVIIVHNKKMESYFIDMGVQKDKIVVLDIFDYLQNNNFRNEPQYKKLINIAGNLDVKKSMYIEQLGKLKNIDIKLFGPNYSLELNQYSNIKYEGTVSPDIIPQMLTAGFGLVWDGNSIKECCGNTGNYLRYNNPHKLSLYLASGLPVVIWENAAEANFVKVNKIGITVKSLEDLEEILKKYTKEDYEIMVQNVQKISSNLSNGYYTKKALDNSVKIINK